MKRLAQMLCSLRAERGQTATEYMGVILVLASIIGVVAAADIGGQIAGGVERQVCEMVSDDCGPAKDETNMSVPEAQREQEFLDKIDPGVDDLNRNGIPDPNEFEGPPPQDEDEGGVPGFVHLGLDGLGLVPVVGEPFDLANCGIYAAEGEKVDAALSCTSAVPVAGYGASAAKAAKRAKEAAEAGSKAVKVVDGLPLGKLRSIGPSTWRSGGGLIYGPHPKDGNRVNHVLRHAERDLVREAQGKTHTVFAGTRSDVLPTIDDAWTRRGRPVSTDQASTVYEVPMGRAVGTNGEQRVRIIVKRGTNEVRSAYPIP